jgi:hypothetical protein
MAPRSVSIWWRPSRSVIRTSRTSATPTRPSSSSLTDGSTLNSVPARSAMRRTSRTNAPSALDTAKMTVPATGLRHRGRQVAPAAEHADAADAQVPLGRIVVENADGQVPAVGSESIERTSCCPRRRRRKAAPARPCARRGAGSAGGAGAAGSGRRT